MERESTNRVVSRKLSDELSNRKMCVFAAVVVWRCHWQKSTAAEWTDCCRCCCCGYCCCSFVLIRCNINFSIRFITANFNDFLEFFFYSIRFSILHFGRADFLLFSKSPLDIGPQAYSMVSFAVCMCSLFSTMTCDCYTILVAIARVLFSTFFVWIIWEALAHFCKVQRGTFDHMPHQFTAT